MVNGVSKEFLHKVLIILGVAVIALAVCVAVAVGSRVFLLFFAALLFAVFLRRIGTFFQKRIGVPHKVGVIITLVLLIAAVGFLTAAFSVNIAEQIAILSDLVQESISDLQAQLEDSGWFQLTKEDIPDITSLLSSGKAAIGDITRAVSVTVGFVISGLIILVVGVFFAMDAERYRRGLTMLVPPRNRGHAEAVFDHVMSSLWLWLAGRFISMALIGVMTTAVLIILDIPMPVTLGMIAALLTFIPNIGAVVAIVLPALLALQQGIGTVIAVVSAYTAIQLAESYGITPLVQQKVANLPGALVIFSQILAGILFGFLGLALASPLTVIAMVLIDDLYVKPREAQAEGTGVEEPSRA